MEQHSLHTKQALWQISWSFSGPVEIQEKRQTYMHMKCKIYSDFITEMWKKITE